ncbi:MAG: hypothetical protein IPH28_19735 [Cytophagaceae bacterium]|nr:hypothetical protein [Cytophagaceae bacterium]
MVASLVIPLFQVQFLLLCLFSSSIIPCRVFIGFYGLALLGASHFTVRDVYFLGLFEVILGILT